jgi:hypothetical protein
VYAISRFYRTYKKLKDQKQKDDNHPQEETHSIS